MSSKYEALLKPLKIGKLTMKNRMVVPPLTRARAGLEHIPNDMMVKHYSDRASFGLIIAEATMTKDGYSTFRYEPGIYNEAQVAGWKKVTDAVHAKGGLIYSQIHHGGRSTIPGNLKEGLVVESSSTKGIREHGIPGLFTPDGQKQKYPETVHQLTIPEIKEIVQWFVKGAKNSIAAGFDGVQVHGANGYLLDQFIKESCNDRTDEYGGNIPNRCRLLLEVVDEVCKAVGPERVSVRISPLNTYNEAVDSNPDATTQYLCEEFNKRGLAFLDVLRADLFSSQGGGDQAARKHYKGVLLSGVGISPDEAVSYLTENRADAICFGKLSIANPDLPVRLAKGLPLNEPRPDLFYTHGEEGYNDYPLVE